MRDIIWKDREVKSGDSVLKERDAAIGEISSDLYRFSSDIGYKRGSEEGGKLKETTTYKVAKVS